MVKQTLELEDIAERQLLTGHPEEAAQLCELHLDDNPPSIGMLRILTAACERLGRLERAYQVALRWASLAPFDAFAHFKLGMLEQARGQFRQAQERYALAHDMAGDTVELGRAAEEAMQALDIMQLQQISALAEVDVAFRKRLRQDVRDAVEERGFVLSHRGLITVVHAILALDDHTGKPLGGTYFM